MKQFAGITEGLKGLQAEYTSLFDSIKDEMPEKEMGVVESNVRKRMEEVSKEKLSLEQELKDALKRVSETEVDPIRIPYEFYEVGGITGGMSLPHPNPKPNESPTTTPGIPPTLTANFIVDGRTMAKASAAPLAKYMELNGVAAA